MFTIVTQDRHGVIVGGVNLKQSGDDYKRGVLEGMSRTLMAEGSLGVMIRNNSEGTPFLEAEPGDNISLQPNARGSVRKGYSGAVSTAPDAVLEENLRIRKLTPLECWRLQGFPDEVYDLAAAVCSKTQLYKQAGNSVTIPVIYEIAKRIAEIYGEEE
jgi:DNA (cytosine-5)-methyltransferase 1